MLLRTASALLIGFIVRPWCTGVRGLSPTWDFSVISHLDNVNLYHNARRSGEVATPAC